MDNNPDKENPANIEKYLKGMHYPASKQDILDFARGKGAPESVYAVLSQIADGEYTSPTDVAEAVGDVI